MIPFLLSLFKVKNKLTGKVLIVAESRLSQLPSKKTKSDSASANGPKEKTSHKKEDKNSHSAQQGPAIDSSTYEVVSKHKGADLVGKRYAGCCEVLYLVPAAKVLFVVLQNLLGGVLQELEHLFIVTCIVQVPAVI